VEGSESRNISMTISNNQSRNIRSSIASETVLMVPNNELERSHTEHAGNAQCSRNILDDI